MRVGNRSERILFIHVKERDSHPQGIRISGMMPVSHPGVVDQIVKHNNKGEQKLLWKVMAVLTPQISW